MTLSGAGIFDLFLSLSILYLIAPTYLVGDESNTIIRIAGDEEEPTDPVDDTPGEEPTDPVDDTPGDEPTDPVDGGGDGIINAGDLEAIDLRTQTVEFTISRSTDFNNTVGFYVVEENGDILDSLSGDLISPGDEDYTQAAINNRLDISVMLENEEETTFSAELPGGQIIAPFIVVNSDLHPLLDDHPGNDPTVYFSFDAANRDGFDHVRFLGNNTLGFEDVENGGDLDYNDIIIEYDFV